MKSARFHTFGCKANQYDTQILREALLRRGLSEGEREADLVVINTCTVTAEAGRKARSLVRRIARETPAAKICVTGCLAESEPEVLRELPNVHWVLGNGEAKRPANFLRQLGFEADPEELGVPAGITAFAGHTRAFVKIQDGCDRRCAFCIIPTVRGPSRSRPAPELAREVRELVEAGYVEIVLCGIHIGHWGRECGSCLAELVAQLADLEPRDAQGHALEYRLRLSSIEATEVDDALLDHLASRPDRLASHLHMPLQSGDDRILAHMNRWYDMRTYLAACERILDALERPAFSADVLVGFPGEDEQAFENTLRAVRTVGFARVHAFPFSPRPGTAAAQLDQAVPIEQIRERRARLSELAHEQAGTYRQSLDGARDRIVLEGFAGLSGRYQRVRVPQTEIEGPPPPWIDVKLEARPGPSGEVELIGHPQSCAAPTL